MRTIPKESHTSHILVVDDDEAVARGVATLLGQAGYRTSCVYTGGEAQALLTHPVQLVILDVMLPDLDGFTLCRHIRQLPTYIPILMLTARDELSDKVLGLELGADEYVTKPFEPRELLARVRAMLRFAEQHRAQQGAAERPLMGGPVKLWKEQHRVEVDGRLVDLTPKEWDVLALLMEHPGKVFGRQTLLSRVWGADFLGDSRVVDVLVQRLRAKLEPYASSQYIQTVRGFGYRFAPTDSDLH